MPNLATRVLLRSDRHRLLVFLLARLFRRRKSLDGDVEIVAVGVSGPRLRIRTIGRPLRRRIYAGLHQPARNLLLALHMETEMVQAGGLAIGLIRQKRERDVSVGHVDRAAARHALGLEA